MSKPKVALFKRLLSYFKPIQLEISESADNPYLAVSLEAGVLKLNTANANYSFGGLHQVFQKTFQKVNVQQLMPKSVLILGFGVGSIASILLKELKINCEIDGVEIDSEILRIYHDYFNLETNQLQIIQQNAFEFIANTKKQYDLIAVDIYINDRVPEQGLKPSFLDLCINCLKPNGVLINNIVIKHNTEELAAQKLFNYLEQKEGRCKQFLLYGANNILAYTKP